MNDRVNRTLPGQAFLDRGHPLRPREPAMGYASRLAALNRVTLPTLLSDMRIDLRELGRGSPDALKAIAGLRGLGGADRDALARYSPWRDLNSMVSNVAGHKLPPRSVLNVRLRICPHCISEDMTEFTGPVGARPWLRLDWVLGPVRVCGRHGNLLIEIKPARLTQFTFDFSETISTQVLPTLDRLREESVPRPGQGYRDWLIGRLDGDRNPANWLDDVPLHAAIVFCELLGFSSRYGFEIAPTSLSFPEAASCAEDGYRAASEGEAAINARLDRMVEARPSVRGPMGHRNIYGHLYAYLMRCPDDPGFEKVRALVREHAFANLPFNPGREVLGVKLDRRRVHNLRVAAESCSRTDAFMKRVWAAVDGASPGSEPPRERRMIRSEEVEAMVARLSDHMTMSDVSAMTGIDVRVVKQLTETGHLPTLPKHERFAGPKHQILRPDVEAMMSRLFLYAEQVAAPTDRRMSVAKALCRSRGRASEILDLILRGKLDWVGSLGAGGRYEHLMVDVEELIARRQERTARIGLFAHEARDLLNGVPKGSMWPLAKAGLFSLDREFCPVARKTVRVFRRESVAAFAADYVTATELQSETGVYGNRLARLLSDAGVTPAADRGVVGVLIFRRRDIAASRAFERRKAGTVAVTPPPAFGASQA